MSGDVNYEAYTVDELLEPDTEQAGLFDRLGGITATRSSDGIEVTVNLEGRLIGLALAPHALGVDPARLAAEIFQLTQQASAAALAEGIATLAPVAGEELTAELTELLDADPPQPARRPLDDQDDFSAVESWALPR